MRFPALWSSNRCPDEHVVHVENMAAAHLLASSRLRRCSPATDDELPVDGEAFNIADFDQNIVSLYHEAGGTGSPRLTLPFWLLFMLVRISVFVAIVLHTVFRVQILHPKTGLHEAALSAGLPATMDTTKARRALGYQTLVSREAIIQHSAKWVLAGQNQSNLAPITPLLQVDVLSK